jgi:hypothetical protein
MLANTQSTPLAALPKKVSGAFLMPWLDDVPTVLYQLMPGIAAGKAAGDVITGQVNPSGKLTVSFPASMDATWLGSPKLNPQQYVTTLDIFPLHNIELYRRRGLELESFCKRHYTWGTGIGVLTGVFKKTRPGRTSISLAVYWPL